MFLCLQNVLKYCLFLNIFCHWHAKSWPHGGHTSLSQVSLHSYEVIMLGRMGETKQFNGGISTSTTER